MTYDNFLFTIEQFCEGETHAAGSYDFKKDLSEDHTYILGSGGYPYTLVGIAFRDQNTMSTWLPCYFFPYD
jgi:hypothetical protein